MMLRQATLTLDGQTHTLKLTFAFVALVEGKGFVLRDLGEQLFVRNEPVSRLTDIVTILHCAYQANGIAMDYEALGDAVMEDQAGATAALMEVVYTALFGVPKEPTEDEEGGAGGPHEKK